MEFVLEPLYKILSQVGDEILHKARSEPTRSNRAKFPETPSLCLGGWGCGHVPPKSAGRTGRSPEQRRTETEHQAAVEAGVQPLLWRVHRYIIICIIHLFYFF